MLLAAAVPLRGDAAPETTRNNAPVDLEMLDVRGPWRLEGLAVTGLPAFRVWLVESGLQTRPLPFWDFWSRDPEFVPAFLEADAETVRRQLERDGWLQHLLADVPLVSVARRSAGNLATPAVAGPDYQLAQDWAVQLEALLERMRDSLDEY